MAVFYYRHSDGAPQPGFQRGRGPYEVMTVYGNVAYPYRRLFKPCPARDSEPRQNACGSADLGEPVMLRGAAVPDEAVLNAGTVGPRYPDLAVTPAGEVADLLYHHAYG